MCCNVSYFEIFCNLDDIVHDHHRPWCPHSNRFPQLGKSQTHRTKQLFTLNHAMQCFQSKRLDGRLDLTYWLTFTDTEDEQRHSSSERHLLPCRKTSPTYNLSTTQLLKNKESGDSGRYQQHESRKPVVCSRWVTTATKNFNTESHETIKVRKKYVINACNGQNEA